VIVAHPGWGEALFLKDIYPQVPLLNFCEFYYHGRGADIGFDRDEDTSIDIILRARARNAHLLLSLEACDAGLAPTRWQKSVHPKPLQNKIRVIFDGIDTDHMAPDPAATFTLPDGRILSRADEIVTFAVRNLEPQRGFPELHRALPKLLEMRPNARVLVVGRRRGQLRPPCRGGEKLARGDAGRSAARPFPRPFPRQAALRPVSLGAANLLGAHLFDAAVRLSWSCIEAMSIGCLVIGSKTPPVQEVIADGVNGLPCRLSTLPDAIAEKTAEVLAAGPELDRLRRRARETVLDRYALSKCLPAQLRLVREVAGR
jgi:glycosyltransferase involved in cell wall biosynthesis